jgi:hypothetical protein
MTSRQQYTDALFIFDRTNVSAARVLDEAYGGGCVWSKEGSDLQESSTNCSVSPNPAIPEPQRWSSAPVCCGRHGERVRAGTR